MTDPLVIAKAHQKDLALLPGFANRHGLITGATGTGKTVTLQKIAESLAALGVPVFMTDIKGDLSGIAASGTLSPKLEQRLRMLDITDWEPAKSTTVFWDIFGETGHPVRATVSEMGPLLFGRLLSLNETQTGVLNLVFKIADDTGLLLLDLKDLRAAVQFIGDNARSFSTQYGNITTASIGTIQRGLLTLEQQGGDRFFGEPAFDSADLMRCDGNGKGIVSILNATKLSQAPRLYSTVLLWLLSELFEKLPEVGDLEKPKLVLFFDEAHLLFNEISNVLLEKIEQVVRLIRSKGVGIYFVSQNPLDIPESVSGQLGNRVQHALRAFTPRDQKAVRTAAQTLRPNPEFDTEKAIGTLGVGEALVSFLDSDGRPSIVERAFILAPGSRIGPLRSDETNALLNTSPFYGRYEEAVDRESAFEILQNRVNASREETPPPRFPRTSVPNRSSPTVAEPGSLLNDFLFGSTGPRGGRRDGVVQSAAKSMARSVASSLGREILRGVLGSMIGGGGKRR